MHFTGLVCTVYLNLAIKPKTLKLLNLLNSVTLRYLSYTLSVQHITNTQHTLLSILVHMHTYVRS